MWSQFSPCCSPFPHPTPLPHLPTSQPQSPEQMYLFSQIYGFSLTQSGWYINLTPILIRMFSEIFSKNKTSHYALSAATAPWYPLHTMHSLLRGAFSVTIFHVCYLFLFFLIVATHNSEAIGSWSLLAKGNSACFNGMSLGMSIIL